MLQDRKKWLKQYKSVVKRQLERFTGEIIMKSKLKLKKSQVKNRNKKKKLKNIKLRIFNHLKICQFWKNKEF